MRCLYWKVLSKYNENIVCRPKISFVKNLIKISPTNVIYGVQESSRFLCIHKFVYLFNNHILGAAWFQDPGSENFQGEGFFSPLKNLIFLKLAMAPNLIKGHKNVNHVLVFSGSRSGGRVDKSHLERENEVMRIHFNFWGNILTVSCFDTRNIVYIFLQRWCRKLEHITERWRTS